MITTTQLRKLKSRLATLRKNKMNISFLTMEQFAKQCGRYRHDRGKEPTYLSEWLETAKPLTIPYHGRGKSLAVGTAGKILDLLEQDLFMIEELIDERAGG